jgi:hypothetical protein
MESLVTWGFKMPRQHWATLRELRKAAGERLRTLCSHDGHEFHVMGSRDG